MSSPRNRKAVVFIHIFLAVQILAPLSYYTIRADRNDERFAWRMFSSVRMLRCQVEFRTGPEAKPVGNLQGIFHQVWVRLAQRGRMEVIQAMAQELCEREGAEREEKAPEVRVQIACLKIDGEREERGGSWNACRLGSL